ncbi:hypothetical protein PSHT_08059 [Puccinia striiformis]|uniref:Uncharacterized protein n=1 Tax=Puccinia striiformis TaxID=27350 RepID=A0A2S4VSL7_9BASI|nr:hypothetical protein PSHT_08059 [Puccinia striiformis]
MASKVKKTSNTRVVDDGGRRMNVARSTIGHKYNVMLKDDKMGIGILHPFAMRNLVEDVSMNKPTVHLESMYPGSSNSWRPYQEGNSTLLVSSGKSRSSLDRNLNSVCLAR